MIAKYKAVLDQFSCFRKPCLRIVVDCYELFPCLYRIADALVEFEPHGVVDDVFFFAAPASEDSEGDTEIAAMRSSNETGFSRCDMFPVLGRGQ